MSDSDSSMEPLPPMSILRYGFASIVTFTFGYGLYVATTAMTWYHLRTRASRQGRRLIVAFTAAMFLLSFATYLSEMVVLEATVIEAPAMTSEASAIWQCGPWQFTNTITSNVQVLLSDALMIYRTYALFSSQKAFMIAPIVLWVGLAGLSIAVFVTDCGLQVAYDQPVNIMPYYNAITAWYAVTAALQVLTTSMIAAKLLVHRRALKKRGLGASASELGYVSLVGVLTESAVLYTVATVVNIPLIRGTLPVQYWWGVVVQSLAFLNPAFIILRVVMGQSYAAAILTSTPPHSALQFSSHRGGQDSTLFTAKQTASRDDTYAMSVRCDIEKDTV